MWTYDNVWYWAAAQGHQAGHVVGLNLGYGFGDTTAASENMVPLSEDEDAAIYYSSGTTGFPKAILHHHQSLTQAAEMEAVHHGTTHEDTFLCIPPLYHTGAMMPSPNAYRPRPWMPILPHSRRGEPPQASDSELRSGFSRATASWHWESPEGRC